VLFDSWWSRGDGGQVASRERRNIASLIETEKTMGEAVFDQLVHSVPISVAVGFIVPRHDFEFVGRLVGIVSRGKM